MSHAAIAIIAIGALIGFFTAFGVNKFIQKAVVSAAAFAYAALSGRGIVEVFDAEHDIFKSQRFGNGVGRHGVDFFLAACAEQNQRGLWRILGTSQRGIGEGAIT